MLPFLTPEPTAYMEALSIWSSSPVFPAKLDGWLGLAAGEGKVAPAGNSCSKGMLLLLFHVHIILLLVISSKPAVPALLSTIARGGALLLLLAAKKSVYSLDVLPALTVHLAPLTVPTSTGEDRFISAFYGTPNSNQKAV